MSAPQVSVVMGVYNGAATLRRTLDSVLAQRGVDLELIVVDDGSTDATPRLLADYARTDARVRALTQSNQGLTRALVRGCAAARGAYIARQDNGDLSLPGRLAAEVAAAARHADAALVSCGTRFVGPAGELLYEVAIGDDDAQRGLTALDPLRLHAPQHGSTLFPRALYERVGGYRPQFYFAQDLDLWTRLVEHGRHVAVADMLYVSRFEPGSISSIHRRRQLDCARLIVECARLRRAGRDEAPVLRRAEAQRPARRAVGRYAHAAALYFVGACLRERADPNARRYFREALQAFPFHVKSAMRLLLG